MTYGRADPHCDRCPAVGYPACERCGRPVLGITDWVHAHTDTDPPAWWHASCWAVRMRELDPFTEGAT